MEDLSRIGHLILILCAILFAFHLDGIFFYIFPSIINIIYVKANNFYHLITSNFVSIKNINAMKLSYKYLHNYINERLIQFLRDKCNGMVEGLFAVD
jgi:hypothetical protein